MKKVLFATTALVATAGVAQADIALSGFAEMGIVNGDTIANTGVVTARDAQFHTDIDVTFTMSGTTDAGLTFGASVDLDEGGAQAAHNDDADDGGATIFISGNGYTLTMGDTDGGFDWGMAEVPAGPGSIDGAHEGLGWNGNGGEDGTYDGQIVSLTTTVGGLGVAVSAEIDDTAGAAGGDAVLGLGLRYSVGDFNLGAGYQTHSTAANVETTVSGISVGTTMNGISIGVNYSNTEVSNDVDDVTHFAIGMSYSVDAWSFGVNYGAYDNVGHVANDEVSSIGVSAAYNLGGGASVQFGAASSDATIGGVNTDATRASLGLSMSF